MKTKVFEDLIYSYFISSREVDVKYFGSTGNVHEESDDRVPIEMLYGAARRSANLARAIF